MSALFRDSHLCTQRLDLTPQPRHGRVVGAQLLQLCRRNLRRKQPRPFGAQPADLAILIAEQFNHPPEFPIGLILQGQARAHDEHERGQAQELPGRSHVGDK
jgi:hypothetical protein